MLPVVSAFKLILSVNRYSFFIPQSMQDDARPNAYVEIQVCSRKVRPNAGSESDTTPSEKENQTQCATAWILQRFRALSRTLRELFDPSRLLRRHTIPQSRVSALSAQPLLSHHRDARHVCGTRHLGHHTAPLSPVVEGVGFCW